MDPAAVAFLAGLVALAAVGLFLRRRYGNLYERLSAALERSTGLTFASVARVLGLATLVLWAAIYLFYGSERETGLKELFPGLGQGGPEAPEEP